MRNRDRLPLLGCVSLALSGALSGCVLGNPGSIRYDPTVRNAGGTIALSDPKLYSRETLINQRTRDLAWINKLIEDSADPAKVSFKPSLYREVELVSALSASLGLKFDPTAAVSNQHLNALGEMQQQYDALKLQLILEQLKVDAANLRKQLGDQTGVATSVLGTPGSVSTPGSSTAVTAPDTAALNTALNALMTSLTGRLEADVKPVSKTDETSNPIDDFQDRLAYVHMLEAAAAALGMDELHDAGNNRLVRLAFQATVFPDPKNARSLGAVQLKISGGTSSRKYLLDWLRWINTDEAWRTSDGVKSSTIDALVEGGYFALANYPAPGGQSLTKMLLPIVVADDGEDLSPDQLRKSADWTFADDKDRDRFTALLTRYSQNDGAAELATQCATPGGSVLTDLLSKARAREQSFDLITVVNQVYTDLNQTPQGTSIDDKLRRARKFHETMLDAMKSVPACQSVIEDHPLVPIGTALNWKLFQLDGFATSTPVRIYEVGPREQAQQVSTVARSANSLALAASIVGSVPQAGVGANISAGYRRDLMTRASALDRVPEVVGYSVGGQKAFGWVIGPHATTNEKGSAEVFQSLRPYDLSVDLSVPSWWSNMTLKLVTAWAPSPRGLATGSLALATKEAPIAPSREAHNGGGGSNRLGGPAVGKGQQALGKAAAGEGDDPGNVIVVPLPAAAADFEAFTQFLTKDGKPVVQIRSIAGGPINACSATTLIVNGPGLWRADRVVVLGTSIGRDGFSIAPGMRGIIVTVPVMAAVPAAQAHKHDPNIHVLTPLGEGVSPIDFIASPSGDDCKVKPVADTKAVTVATVAPDSIVVPSTISFDVTGANLASVDSVKLGRQPGTIATPRATDGKSLTVVFDDKATGGIDTGKAKIEFFSKDGKIVASSPDIRVIRSPR